MDVIFQKLFADAARDVAEGNRRVQRQREICLEQSQAKHSESAALAATTLVEFEKIQKLFVADRDRLLQHHGSGAGLRRNPSGTR